jgi:hypothetical protein
MKSEEIDGIDACEDGDLWMLIVVESCFWMNDS